MADPLVAEWHCRDLDSRISSRELAAVNNWRTSNKTYHIMRDNKYETNKKKLFSKKKFKLKLNHLIRYHVATIVGCCFGMKSDIKTSAIHQQDFEQMLDFVKDRYINPIYLKKNDPIKMIANS